MICSGRESRLWDIVLRVFARASQWCVPSASSIAPEPAAGPSAGYIFGRFAGRVLTESPVRFVRCISSSDGSDAPVSSDHASTIDVSSSWESPPISTSMFAWSWFPPSDIEHWCISLKTSSSSFVSTSYQTSTLVQERGQRHFQLWERASQETHWTAILNTQGPSFWTHVNSRSGEIPRNAMLSLGGQFRCAGSILLILHSSFGSVDQKHQGEPAVGSRLALGKSWTRS